MRSLHLLSQTCVCSLDRRPRVLLLLCMLLLYHHTHACPIDLRTSPRSPLPAPPPICSLSHTHTPSHTPTPHTRLLSHPCLLTPTPHSLAVTAAKFICVLPMSHKLAVVDSEDALTVYELLDTGSTKRWVAWARIEPVRIEPDRVLAASADTHSRLSIIRAIPRAHILTHSITHSLTHSHSRSRQVGRRRQSLQHQRSGPRVHRGV